MNTLTTEDAHFLASEYEDLATDLDGESESDTEVWGIFGDERQREDEEEDRERREALRATAREHRALAGNLMLAAGEYEDTDADRARALQQGFDW